MPTYKCVDGVDLTEIVQGTKTFWSDGELISKIFKF